MGKKTTELSPLKLSPQAETFCAAYTSIGSETFSRGTKSALAAKYSEKSARNVSTALLRRPAIQSRIAELHQANMVRNGITVDKVLADLENLRLRSEDRGDFGTSFRCSEAEAKYLALFTDRVELVGPEKRAELDERECAELLALASIRLGACLSLPGGDGDGDGDNAAVRMISDGEKRPDGEGLHPRPGAARSYTTPPGA